MKQIDEIKQLMAAGDTAQADKALKELLAKEPDNLQAKMLYGTCRQLLGDEETFKRIHDELAPGMERLEKKEPKAETVSLWKKYHALWISLIVSGLVLAVGVAVMKFGAEINERMNMPTCCPLGGNSQEAARVKVIEKQTEFSDIKNDK